MSLEEVRTRIAQEAGKRFDLALYRWDKLDHAQRPLEPSSRPARFFFSLDDVRERARLVRETLPTEADAVIQEADAICRHQFHLLGYKNVDYGTEIDWHLDAVHRRRAPLKPFRRSSFGAATSFETPPPAAPQDEAECRPNATNRDGISTIRDARPARAAPCRSSSA